MSSRKKKGPPKRLFQRVKPLAIPDGYRLVPRPAGEEKMSDALARLVEPYLNSSEDEETMRSLLRFGVLAWNYALMAEATRSRSLDRFLGEVDAEDRDAMRSFLLGIVQRKLDLFPDNLRVIRSFEVTDTGRRFHISVASEPGPVGPPEAAGPGTTD